MRRTVVLAGYYGFGNTGDEAILTSILAGLRRRVPGTAFIVVSGDPEATRTQHGVEPVGWRDISAISASIAKSDVVLVGGGGLFQDYWGLDTKTLLTPRHGEIAFYAGPVVLAALARKPALLYGLGFGPLASPEARRYARAVADAAVYLSVRDEASRDLLVATGVPEARITVTADPAFALEVPDAPAPADLCRAAGIVPRGPILGVALRPWSIGVEQAAWESEVAAALEQFLEQTEGTLLFVPFEKSPWTEKDDFDQASRLAAALSAPGREHVAIAKPLSPRDTAALLSGCDLVLGMRLHSLVFAAAGGVPAVGLAYDPKVTALLSRLGAAPALPLAKLTSQDLLDALLTSLEESPAIASRLGEAAGRQRALAEEDLDRAARLISNPPAAPEISRAVLGLFDDALEANRGHATEIEAGLLAAKGGLDALERAHAREKALLEERLGETRQELARLQGSTLWRIVNLFGRLRQAAAESARRILGRPASDWAGPDAGADAARHADAAPMPDESRYDVVWLGRGEESSLSDRSRAILEAYRQQGHRVFVVPPAQAGALDALRREESLAATAAFIDDSEARPHARRMRAARGWLLVDATGEPDHSSEPPDVVLDPAASPVDVLHAMPGFFPGASVVVVTKDNRDLNRLCLESLRARTDWPNFEVLVIDNGSTDGTVALLRELAAGWPRLRVIENAENRGFAAAANQGFAAVSPEAAYLVTLNNDTVVTRGWLTALLAHLKADPKLGLVGPVTNAIANEAQVDIGYGGLADLPAKAAEWVRAHDGETFAIPMLAFFCAALRRQTWEAVGPLDERFGAGMFEDDDWCRRARAQGWEIRCARDAYVHHWQKATFRKLGERAYHALYEENRRKYEEKWGGDAAAASAGGARDAPRADLGKYRSQLASILESRGGPVPAGGVPAVVFLPSIGWGIHLFQRPHHLARAFARAGWLSIFDCSNAQDRVDGFKEIEPNLFLYRGPAGVLERLPSPLLWSFPYNFHQTRDYSADARRQVVYDWIDDLSVFPYDMKLLETNHDAALSEAAVVAAVARRLHAEALARRPDALYLPNGVEYERFAAPPSNPAAAASDRDVAPLLASGRPVAGYYGALAEWFDYELVDEAARLRPDWSFLLIGPMYDQSLQGRPMLKRENVRWIGPRDYHLLPGYLALFDVATIPFRINPITTATSPLKLYEYFAGGKPVVTTPMPECAAFPEVTIVQDARELADALDPARARGRDSAFRDRLRALGRENSWDARVRTVLANREARV